MSLSTSFFYTWRNYLREDLNIDIYNKLYKIATVNFCGIRSDSYPKLELQM